MLCSATNKQEIFDLIRNIKDPEFDKTLEDLEVVSEEMIELIGDPEDSGNLSLVKVSFKPTIPHCHMAALIGLCLKIKLLRSLVGNRAIKVKCYIWPGSHVSESEINKQINDKDRVAAAVSTNPELLEVVEECLQGVI